MEKPAPVTGQQVPLERDLADSALSEKDATERDLLEKGFQLAYFLAPERSLAVRILAGALNKLKTHRGRENRRTYWRDKHLKRGITRISRDEQDALQWLIFSESDRLGSDRFESDGDEGPRKSATQSIRDLVVSYINNLVRMTTAMSSFHVNVGLHRLLHNYSTVETQRVYEAVTDRYLGADEYRRAKGVLMSKLEERFHGLLKTVRTQHGELRFDPQPDQDTWKQLVDACLRMFTPWSTNQACPVPSNYDASREKLPARLSGKGPDRVDPNEIEINRCHAFIHPTCYGRLMRALTFDAPGARLALPRFFMDTTNDTTHNDPSDQPPAPRLTAEERKTINDELSAQQARRQDANPQSVIVVVDGAERARLDFGPRRNECRFEILEGAELVEVRARAQGQSREESLLLATFRVPYNAERGIAASDATLFRKGLRRLELNLVPGPAVAEGPRSAVVSLHYSPNPLARWFEPSAAAKRLTGVKYASGAIGLVALGLVLGIASQHRYLATQRSASSTLPLAQPAQLTQPVVPSQAQPPVHAADLPVQEASTRYSYTLAPDDMVVRGAGSADLPSVAVPAQPALLNLELPIAPADAKKSFRASLKQFLKSPELLRENMLTATKTSAGHVVVFPLPSVFLEDRQEYTVDLRSQGSSGEFEETNTYTFRAVRKR